MKKIRAIVIATAVVWAAVLVALSTIVGGSSYGSRVLTLVAGGAVATLIMVAGAWLRPASGR